MGLGKPKNTMEQSRRGLLATGAAALAGLAGCIGAAEPSTTGSSASLASSDGHDGHGGDGGAGSPAASAVTFVRNVEEVCGHLTSSAILLEQARREDAALHAGHGSDYFGPVLTPLRDVDPELATRLRGRLSSLKQAVRSMTPAEYRGHVEEELFPMLDEAVEAVVPGDVRGSTEFDVRVMNALAGRIAEEYKTAVPEAGTIELAGEYWDGRGFLNRIEARFEEVGSEVGAGEEALARLGERMEAVAAADVVLEATLDFRTATAAATPLPAARIEDRSGTVSYVRNLEEARGHLMASTALLEAGDGGAAGLCAGHGADYVIALVPAVRRADSALVDELRTRLLEVDSRIADGADGYADYVESEVMPVLDRVPAAAVPAEHTDSISFSAAVVVALAGRIAEEYEAAVTDEELIELYGEY